MDEPRWETGDTPRLIISTIGGDLRLGASEGGYVEAQGPDADDLRVRPVEGGLEIECHGDCRLLAPAGASVEAGAIGGDAAIHGLRGDLLLKAVGGDLRLTQVGQTAVETVGGDVAVDQVAGSFMVDLVGGRAVVEAIDGAVHLRSVGGDLRLRGVEGPVQATAGGSAVVQMYPPKGSRSAVQAGGDLRCTLPEGASVQIQGYAGGDVRLAVPVECEEVEGGCRVSLGQGEAELELRAGGDLSLRTEQGVWQAEDLDLGDAIATSVGAEIGAKMAELEFKLNGLGERLPFDTRRLGRRVRREVERAHRRAEQARQRAEAVRGLSQEVEETGIDEEAMLILRMLEQGKLSVDQADGLLEALEE